MEEGEQFHQLWGIKSKKDLQLPLALQNNLWGFPNHVTHNRSRNFSDFLG